MLVPAAAVIIVLTTMSLRSLAEAPLVGRDGAGGGVSRGLSGIQGWGPASRAGALPPASAHPLGPQQPIATVQPWGSFCSGQSARLRPKPTETGLKLGVTWPHPRIHPRT